LHDKAFDEDRDEIINEMKRKGIGSITIGTDIEESKKAIALSEKHENIFASVGCHPADNTTEIFDEKKYEELAQHKKVVAIGECGLDYFRLKENIDEAKQRQKDIFKKQIDIAIKVNKPLMLHGRGSANTMDAYEDMLEILEEAYKESWEKACLPAGRLKGNAHFFAGNIDIAERFLKINFTLSFSGVITFAKDYDEVVHFVPLDMVHAETDSPYATPVPYRGKRNSSLYIQEIVARIAVIRQENFEDVRMQLLENVKRVFGV
jgi:TatD DNase family protein